MKPRITTLPLILFSLGLLLSVAASAQTLLDTVDTGVLPIAAAANRGSNKIYVANYCGNDSSCQSAGTVTVIDGATDHTATVTAGFSPYDVRANPLTNKIYVPNFCGNDVNCQSNGTVTVINGADNSTATVTVGPAPYQAAINTATNKIYVANAGGNTVTVIDGATNATTPVTVGNGPEGLAVNQVTNKIYVPNFADGTVTVIDGATLATSTVQAGGVPTELAVNSITNQIYVANSTSNDVTVIDGVTLATTTVNVDLNPTWIVVNAVTNKIYTANFGSDTVTEIDGATNNATNITVGSAPYQLTVDPVTNKIYVANYGDNSMTMIDAANNNHTTTLAVGATPGAIEANVVTNRVYVPNYGDNTLSVVAGANAAPLQFVAVAPCRVVDTRNANGTFGGPPLQGGSSRSFPIPQQTTCNIPATAAAFSLNVTVVPHGQLGYLTIWPTGEDQPLVSTMNSLDGRIKANAAIVPAGYQGGVTLYVTNTTDLVLDIDGYFAPPSQQTLEFYPLPPCRVFDTRNSNGDLGGPHLFAQQERDFPILEATQCNIPSTAQAYSLNFTAVPVDPQLGYLTIWPTGQTKPLVSTLNDLTGTIVANAAIVPAGTGGKISAYPSNNTNLIADINGYFAPTGTGGLSLYPVAPCRVLDTRQGNGAFNGLLNPPVDVANSVCSPPSQSQAYVFNATVVPSGNLGYLTLWPDGGSRPTVSTLNAPDGAITSNMAIVPTSNGKVDAYASGTTQLVLDISSYFAP